jgi:hypothetical protein
MIQRLQSLFLLLASACSFGLFGLPFATTAQPDAASAIFADGVYDLKDNMGMLVLFCLSGALTLASIFFYKNRKTQLLMGRLAIVANIVAFALAIFFYLGDVKNMGSSLPVSDGLGLGLPVLFLVFAFLAQRYIVKDEKLVRSMDRLR